MYERHCCVGSEVNSHSRCDGNWQSMDEAICSAHEHSTAVFRHCVGQDGRHQADVAASEPYLPSKSYPIGAAMTRMLCVLLGLRVVVRFHKCLSKINFIFVSKILDHPFDILNKVRKVGICPEF